MDIEALRYPIGKFRYDESETDPDPGNAIAVIRRFPNDLKAIAESLTEKQLDTAYRPGGWTARQVIHHCADSHMNALIRFKLALTEESPRITGYNESLWAEMKDADRESIISSILIIVGLHHRWSVMLERLSPDDLRRGYFHPEKARIVTLHEAIHSYAWHCKHHLEHIKICMNQ